MSSVVSRAVGRNRRSVRGAGAALVVLAPVVLGLGLASTAGAAVVPAANPPTATDHPLLDGKWNGTSDTTAGVPTASCDYPELTQAHGGVGWHFVLPGKPANMSSFSAHFATAGTVTVTTTETASGVIVQGGKGAVIYTAGHDTLSPLGSWHDANGNHAGQGVNSAANSHYLQLSHLCGGASPSDTPSETPSESPSEHPTPSHHPKPTHHPTQSPSENGTPSVGATESSGPAVEGTKHTKSPSPAGGTQVLGEKKTRPLPFTGAEIGSAVVLAVALLGLGLIMVLGPERVLPAWSNRRRH